jgi:hypothetical protein
MEQVVALQPQPQRWPVHYIDKTGDQPISLRQSLKLSDWPVSKIDGMSNLRALENQIMQLTIVNNEGISHESPTDKGNECGSKAPEAWYECREDLRPNSNPDKMLESRSAIVEAVDTSGRKISSGMGGTVYEVVGYENKVIKISDGDYGYMYYLDYIDNNPGPHVPEVYVYHIDEATGDAVVVMEMLTPIDPSACSAWFDFLVLANYVLNPGNENCNEQDACDKFLEHYGDAVTEEFCEEILNIYHSSADYFGYNLEDFHSGNVMVRINADGKVDLVVIDPWYSMKSPDCQY